MKKITILLVSVCLFALSCKTKVVPVSEKIKKTWTPNIVKEGSTTVYTKGVAGSTTKPAYSKLVLNLLIAPSVTFIDVDGNTFTGQYEVTDTQLTLKNLNPVPTGSGGTITFTINSVTDTALDITRTTASQKTGGTINQYLLVNP